MIAPTNRWITRGTFLAVLGLAGAWPSIAVGQGSPDVAWIGGGGGADLMAISNDGETIATSIILNETALKIWKVDGTFVRTLAHFTPYWCAAFSPDGQYLAGGRAGLAGDDTATAMIFRVSDGSMVHALNPGEMNNLYIARAVDYSPDGSLLALAYSAYRGIELYDTATGALVQTVGDGGYAVKFSPDGQTLAAARNGPVRLYRVSDGAILHTLSVGATMLSFSADGQYLAVASEQQNWPVRIFRTSDGGLQQTITPSLVQTPQSIAFAPGQNMIVIAGSRDAAAPIPEFNLFSDETIQAYDLDGDVVWSYYHAYGIAFSIGFTPDGQFVMVAGGWATAVPNYVEGGDDSIQTFQASDGVEVAHFSGRRGLSFGVGFSPDSQLFASGGSNTMQIWQVADGTIAHTFENGASSVAFSSDGTKLVAAAGGIQIWSVPGYALLQTLPDPGASQAVISIDGTLIGAGGGPTARLWRVSDGALLWTRPSNAGNVETVALSPDGQVLAAGTSGSTVRLWRTSDGTLLDSIVGQNAIDSIAFSPDGTLLAVGEQAYGNNLKLYNVSDGSLAHSFPGSPWGFEHQSVAFTPDGTKIVFSSGAHFIQFWRISDGSLLQEYDGETGTGYFPWMPVAVSPDGRYVGYGRQDATVVMAYNPFACAADVNQSGAVGITDLLAVLGAWGAAGPEAADVNADGVVDINDFLAVLGAWGPCP